MTPQRRTALVSIGAAALLAALKLGAGLVSGSLGLDLGGPALGDRPRCRAAHVLRDRRLRPARRRRHQYGHGKAEHLAALAEATVLALVSIAVAALAVTRLDGDDEPRGRHRMVALRRRGARALDRSRPHRRLAQHGAPLRQRGAALERDPLRQRLRGNARRARGPRRRGGRLSRRATRSRRSSSPFSCSSPPAG